MRLKFVDSIVRILVSSLASKKHPLNAKDGEEEVSQDGWTKIRQLAEVAVAVRPMVVVAAAESHVDLDLCRARGSWDACAWVLGQGCGPAMVGEGHSSLD